MQAQAQAVAAQVAAQAVVAAAQAGDHNDMVAVQHQLQIQMAQLAAAAPQGALQYALAGDDLGGDHQGGVLQGMPVSMHDNGLGTQGEELQLPPEMQLQLAAGLVSGGV